LHKLTKGICAFAIAFGLQSTAAPLLASAASSSPISVQVNGKVLTFEQAPVLKNNRTLVPLRTIFEALGVEVKWEPKTRSVIAKKEKNSISLKIGSKKALLNQKEIILDTEAQLINGKTMVPLRFIGESLGTTVKWDEKTKTVFITTMQPQEKQPDNIVIPSTSTQSAEPTKPVVNPKPETPTTTLPGTSGNSSSGSNGSGDSSDTSKPNTETPASKQPETTSLQDKLLGKWKTNYGGFNIDVTFNKDNSASLLGGSFQGTYTVSDEKMTLSVPSMNRTTSGTVKFVSENEFTVTSASGNVATFTRAE
jgi:hypothetical protein